MWAGILLLITITALYAGYNLLVKVSSLQVPAAATSTVLATICLQVAALATSVTFAALLVARGGHVLALSPAAYAWAAGAGCASGLRRSGTSTCFAAWAGPVRSQRASRCRQS